MKKTVIKFLTACALFGGFVSCSDNIALDPISQIDSSAGYTTKSDIEAALTGCYSSIQSGNYMGLRYFAFADLYADNLTHVGTFPSFAEIANKNILPNNTELSNMWQSVYSGINRINNVITSAPAIQDKALLTDVVLGEARGLRAFQYFNLLRYYGGSETGYNKADGKGVPLITKPTLVSADTTPLARASEADTWKLILDDLSFAEDKLPTNNGGLGKLNKRSVRALKARAYLYRGDWALAETAADSVITKGGYTLMSSANYANIWLLQNSSESIFELIFDPTNTNSIAFFYYPTTLGGRNEISTSAALNTAHEANDIRKIVNYTTSPAAKTQKFTRVAGTDNVVLLRLAEMYLIRAEARAMQNKFVDALADLNVIRVRAGLTPSVAATQADLLTAIEKERRIELAHEGHRWFDVRRYNKLAAVGITQGFRALWPIPDREVKTSGGIIAQNAGY